MRRRSWASNIARTIGDRATRWLVIAAVASIGLAVVELVISVLIQLFLKNLGLLAIDVKTSTLLGARELSPTKLALILTVLALARSLTLFSIGLSGNISMEMITARIRRITIWDALLHPSRHTVPAASVNANVGDLANKASQFAHSGTMFLAASVQVVALGVVLTYMAARETAIAMLGLGLLGALILRLNRAVRAVAAKVPAELRILMHGIERIARNITLVRVLRTERLEHGKLVDSIDTYATHSLRAAFLANFASALTPFTGILLIIVIVAFSQGVMHTPAITLVSFLYLFVRFVQTLAGGVTYFTVCNSFWPHFAECLSFVNEFEDQDLVNAITTRDDRPPAREGLVVVPGDAPGIVIDAISFAYPGRTQEVLTDVSVKISAGSQFAIVGPSGCGKSTLLGLILGLQEPTRGEVRLGHRRPRDFFEDAHTRVGYVGADAFLVAGSVRDNLRYGLRYEVSDDALWQALSEAQLHAVIHDLPGRLNYMVAEDGSGLSAGQKQRLCLARALLAKPHVLVLDEVSANLDVGTELALAESLKDLRGSTTTILVSHRKDILKYADEVVDLSPSSGHGTDSAR